MWQGFFILSWVKRRVRCRQIQTLLRPDKKGGGWVDESPKYTRHFRMLLSALGAAETRPQCELNEWTSLQNSYTAT